MPEEFVISLLSDEHGINEDAYMYLHDSWSKEHADFFALVKSKDGRYFLPEGWRNDFPENNSLDS